MASGGDDIVCPDDIRHMTKCVTTHWLVFRRPAGPIGMAVEIAHLIVGGSAACLGMTELIDAVRQADVLGLALSGQWHCVNRRRAVARDRWPTPERRADRRSTCGLDDNDEVRNHQVAGGKRRCGSGRESTWADIALPICLVLLGLRPRDGGRGGLAQPSDD